MPNHPTLASSPRPPRLLHVGVNQDRPPLVAHIGDARLCDVDGHSQLRHVVHRQGQPLRVPAGRKGVPVGCRVVGQVKPGARARPAGSSGTPAASVIQGRLQHVESRARQGRVDAAPLPPAPAAAAAAAAAAVAAATAAAAAAMPAASRSQRVRHVGHRLSVVAAGRQLPVHHTLQYHRATDQYGLQVRSGRRTQMLQGRDGRARTFLLGHNTLKLYSQKLLVY